MRLPRKLKTIINNTMANITSHKVCYCYFHTDKCTRVDIYDLSETELNERYYESEWWLEEGDLCLMKGRR